MTERNCDEPFRKLNITSRSSSRLAVKESGHGKAIHLIIGHSVWEMMFLRMTWISENTRRPWSLTVASISQESTQQVHRLRIPCTFAQMRLNWKIRNNDILNCVRKSHKEFLLFINLMIR